MNLPHQHASHHPPSASACNGAAPPNGKPSGTRATPARSPAASSPESNSPVPLSPEMQRAQEIYLKTSPTHPDALGVLIAPIVAKEAAMTFRMQELCEGIVSAVPMREPRGSHWQVFRKPKCEHEGAPVAGSVRISDAKKTNGDRQPGGEHLLSRQTRNDSAESGSEVRRRVRHERKVPPAATRLPGKYTGVPAETVPKRKTPGLIPTRRLRLESTPAALSPAAPSPAPALAAVPAARAGPAVFCRTVT